MLDGYYGISVSPELREKLNAGDVTSHAKIVCGDLIFGYDNKDNSIVPIDDGCLLELTCSYSIASDDFGLGNANPAYCQVSIHGAKRSVFDNAEIKVYLGYELDETYSVTGENAVTAEYPKIEWVPMGIFYTESVQRSGNTINFTAWDALGKLDYLYVPSSNFANNTPRFISDLYEDACNFAGLDYIPIPDYTIAGASLNNKTLEFGRSGSVIFPNVESIYRVDNDGKKQGYTVREILGFCAAIVGGNCIITRDGRVNIRHYSFAQTVVYGDERWRRIDNVYDEDNEVIDTTDYVYTISDGEISTLEISDTQRYPDVIVNSTNGNKSTKSEYEIKDSNQIPISDPWMTLSGTSRLQYIRNVLRSEYTRFKKYSTYYSGDYLFTMSPCQLTLELDDPTLECGDIISYINEDSVYSIPIMNIQFTWSGALYSTISSFHKLESERNGASNSTSSQFTSFSQDVSEKLNDSGWLSITAMSSTASGSENGYHQNINKIKLYSTSRYVQYRRIGNIVYLRGVIGTVDNDSTITTNDGWAFAMLPQECRPKTYDCIFRCQGSASNDWCLRVAANGTLTACRYSGGAEANRWLPFDVCWPI